jgi:predicted transcriptional regulator
MMSNPFEKILGNTCEMRIIEFLLPLEDLEFNVTELSEESGVSRVTAGKVIKKFVEWDLLIKRDDSIPYYRLNHENQIVKSIKLFNTAIIETMLGEEETYNINLLISKKKEQYSLHAPNLEKGKTAIYGYDTDLENNDFARNTPIEQTTPSPAFWLAAGGSYIRAYCLDHNTGAS